jgi:NAD(P)H-dependent FMN reductase
MGATTGMLEAVLAQAEARTVLRTMQADVVENEVPVAHGVEAFHADGDAARQVMSLLGFTIRIATGHIAQRDDSP